jgi:hypothetical protein
MFEMGNGTTTQAKRGQGGDLPSYCGDLGT